MSVFKHRSKEMQCVSSDHWQTDLICRPLSFFIVCIYEIS
jgi:hypothetical protein